MKPETKELLDRLTPQEQIDLLAGLTRKHRQQTAMIAAPVADMLTTHLRVLGLKQDAEYLENLSIRIHNLTWGDR